MRLDHDDVAGRERTDTNGCRLTCRGGHGLPDRGLANPSGWGHGCRGGRMEVYKGVYARRTTDEWGCCLRLRVYMRLKDVAPPYGVFAALFLLKVPYSPTGQ